MRAKETWVGGLGVEEEFHSDSECKLVGEDGGRWKRRQAVEGKGSEGVGTEESKVCAR